MKNKIESERLTAEILSLSGELHENESQIKLAENDAAHLRELIASSGERIRGLRGIGGGGACGI